MMRFTLIAALSLLVVALAACAGGQPEDPAPVVARYLEAKAASDRDTIANLICAELEAQIDLEALSFSGVEAQAQDLACSSDANANTVTCSGAIVAVYAGENREFPLGTYRVVQEDGIWKWCGEA
jgi:hypothetical protein